MLCIIHRAINSALLDYKQRNCMAGGAESNLGGLNINIEQSVNMM